MRKNKLKQIFKEDKAVVNGWLQIPSSFSAEVSGNKLTSGEPLTSKKTYTICLKYLSKNAFKLILFSISETSFVKTFILLSLNLSFKTEERESSVFNTFILLSYLFFKALLSNPFPHEQPH